MTPQAGRRALITLASLVLALAAFSWMPGVLAQAPVDSGSAKVWIGREAEFEEFIRTAEIEKMVDVPIGITRPQRAILKPGGLVESVAWKVLPPSRATGYWESYKNEIAAYELDKLLGLGMVPVAVEKRWKHETGAAILWLSPVHAWKDVADEPKPPHFDREVIRMKMFDNLICNKDRNTGNLLVDEAWNLYLIDHSRAFINSNELPAVMGRIDRDLWDRMLALDEPTLMAVLGKWVARGDLRSMLKRRDRMKIAIEKLVKNSGEAAIFIRR
jgi:hypothetical protein